MTSPPFQQSSPFTCDIFCRVIDNYGDIGVAWRLARQLATEYGVTVRLIVDDLISFQKLFPAVVPDLAEQSVEGVAVVFWCDTLNLSSASDLIIEAFGCELPPSYLAQMTYRETRPVWINLEYLSAESWVENHHLLPSPHPILPLTKFFFFPGFTPRTGGLIRERDLIAKRDTTALSPNANMLHVLIFGYDWAPAEALLVAIAQTNKRTSCSVADGGLGQKLKHWRGTPGKNTPGAAPDVEFHIVSFVAQDKFDYLLWHQDVLFVRGEDSFVRAQWAAKPFVWQVYPQAHGVHLIKMDAFLGRYCAGLAAPVEAAVRELWRAWNDPNTQEIGPVWAAFVDQLPVLNAHAKRWAHHLSEMPDLASNLLSFYGKNVKI